MRETTEGGCEVRSTAAPWLGLIQGWPVATGGPIRSDIVVDVGAGTLVAESADGKTYVLKITQ